MQLATGTSLEFAKEMLYEFSVWPDETKHEANPHIFRLLKQLNTRVVMEFTESDFNAFRAGCLRAGVTLREIERYRESDRHNVL